MSWLRRYPKDEEEIVITIPEPKKQNSEECLMPYVGNGVLYEIGVYSVGDLEWLRSTNQWKELKLEKLRKDAEKAQKRYQEAKLELI